MAWSSLPALDIRSQEQRTGRKVRHRRQLQAHPEVRHYPGVVRFFLQYDRRKRPVHGFDLHKPASCSLHLLAQRRRLHRLHRIQARYSPADSIDSYVLSHLHFMDAHKQDVLIVGGVYSYIWIYNIIPRRHNPVVCCTDRLKMTNCNHCLT